MINFLRLDGLCLIFACVIGTSAQNAAAFDYAVTIHPEKSIGGISPLIYGQYLEHVQADENTIYPSLWDAKSKYANRMGIRTDVTSATRALGAPVVRWPGGCFADTYHWEDAIGPRAKRQPKPNLHWGGTESNMFGTDEFLHWCKLAHTQAYINVNLGSGTLDEALRWLEYCNGDAATTQGARRAKNGTALPYGVPYWGIGNETWGEWETGHTDADTYGTSLSLWAKAMRRQDPTIKILGVGSEEGNNPVWDSTVLAHAAADIDLLTVHMYGVSTTYDGSEYEAFVFTPDYLENRLERMIRTVDTATSAAHRARPINLSIDEWNIRHFFDGKQNRKSPRNLQDALFTAGFLNGMIRLSPRVEMANYVFLVNGNATLLVNGDQIVWTPLAWVFHQYGKWMNGSAIAVDIQGPKTMPPAPVTGFPGRKPAADFEPTPRPWLDAAACRRGDGSTAIALVNRHRNESADVALNIGNASGIVKTWTLTADNIYSANDFQNPKKVTPAETTESGDALHWKCPPHSITLLLCE